MDILRPTKYLETRHLETPRNSLPAKMVEFQSPPVTPRKRRRIITLNPIAITALLIPTLGDHDMNKQDDNSTSSRPHAGSSSRHRRSLSCTRIHLKPRPYQRGSGASGALLTTDFIFEPEEDKKQQYDRKCRTSRSGAPSNPHSLPLVTKSITAGTTTQDCLQHPNKTTKLLGRLPQPRPVIPDPHSSLQKKLEYARCA
jgi:hypothetical protein